jgi:type IV fimbrial biogenesis protein FimT
MLKPNANRGFTMVELLVTVLVVAILSAVAIPAFRTFIQNDRDITQANSLVYSLNYARSESIKRDVAGGVTVCASADGATCSGAVNWATGWIVTTTNAAGVPQLLQAMPALAGNNTVTGTASTITFTSTGTAAAQATIRICDTRGAAFARDVEVNPTGRVATNQTPGQTVAGAALVCP